MVRRFKTSQLRMAPSNSRTFGRTIALPHPFAPSHSLSTLRAAQVTLQARGRGGSALRNAVQLSVLDRIKIAPIDRVLQMILRLRERSSRDVEEACKVGVRSAAESFSDVARRRRRSVPDLIVETKIPFDLRPVR